MPTVNLSEFQEHLLEALVASGHYGNRSEVVRRAIEHFTQNLAPEQRLGLAFELYRQGHATIGRAAEVARLPYDQMYEILGKEGLHDGGRPTRAQIRKGAHALSSHG